MNLQAMQKVQKPVLIVDDIKSMRDLFASLCFEIGITVKTAENGKEALEMVKNEEFSVFIIDMKMPVMDGWELIPQLQESLDEPVILIATTINDPGQIIDIMKKGIFDYVIKPIDPDQLQTTVTKALEFQYLKSAEKERISNSEKKLQGQLEWLTYKEMRIKNEEGVFENKIINNLKSSISQGSGIGSSITIIELIASLAEKKGDTYNVPADLIDLLIENNAISRKTTDNLEQIHKIIGQPVSLKTISFNDFIKKLPDALERVSKAVTRKDLTITFPNLAVQGNFNIDTELMQLVIEELLINAMKYSESKTEINIYAHQANNFCIIGLINQLPKNGKIQIPSGYEKLVVEPFFRNAPTNDQFYDLEVFSLGLGLTVVDFVLKKHFGFFYINQKKDHTNQEPQDCIIAEIQIPIC